VTDDASEAARQTRTAHARWLDPDVPADDHGEWAGVVGEWLLELFEPTPL